MAHAQKPHFVFPRNGRVHLNRWGRQFSRRLAVEVCASAWVMLDTPRSEMAWEYWLPTQFTSFPFTSPPVRHRVPLGSERALQNNQGEEEEKLRVHRCHILQVSRIFVSKCLKWFKFCPCFKRDCKKLGLEVLRLVWRIYTNCECISAGTY